MNVADLFANAAVCYPGKNARIFGDRAYTYAEMSRVVAGMAAYLKQLGAGNCAKFRTESRLKGELQ